MRPNQYIRHNITARSEPKLGRMVVVSFVIHLILLGLFSGVILPQVKTPPRPVYIVDLVNRPVKNPKAGRPDARPKPDQSKPKPAATAPEPKPEAVKLPPKPETSPKPEPEPKPQATSKPTLKAEVKKTSSKPKPADKTQVTAREEQSLTGALDKLKRKREMQELQDKLAAMSAARDTRGAAGDAPVGMPDGTGTEEGVSTDAWLHTFLKEAWRLSKYQLGRTDLSAEAQLVFDSQGRLLSYKFTEKSDDSRFDDSVARAILQLKDYPEPTLAGARKDVVFNLKELLK